MGRLNGWDRRCIAALLALAATPGCEETRALGSGCPNGVCPQALTRNDEPCTVTSAVAQIAITQPPGMLVPARICLPLPLTRRDDGTVNARVFYFLTDDADPSIGCDDKPFLRPVSAATRDAYGSDDGGDEMCELNQLAVIAGDGGAPIVEAGDGFFYDDFSERARSECDGSILLNITDGATPWTGVVVDLTSAETRDEKGEVDPELVCSPIQGTEPVGTPCLPDRGFFDDSEVVIETRSAACGDGLCMAYHLGGDPSCELDRNGPDGSVGDESSIECVDPEQIEARAYCTCRCDGPPGADLCECPSGFSCVEGVPALEPALAGGYCVRNGR